MTSQITARIGGVRISTALIKLLIISNGIAIDGKLLKRTIKNYETLYRVKRSKKNIQVVDGKLLDTSKDDVPFVPDELFIHFDNGKKSVVKVNFRPESDIFLKISSEKLLLEHKSGLFSVACSLSERCVVNTARCMEIIGADRVAVLGYEGCSGWLNKTQCRFCDSAARRETERSPIPTLNDIQTEYHGNIERWLDRSVTDYFPKVSKAFADVCEKVKPHCHLHIMSGNLPDLNMTWKYHIELVRAINAAKPILNFDTYLNILPPMDSSLLVAAKEIGVKNVIFNMEVWGEKDYKRVCPEKSQLISMPLFMERLEEAVDVFGRGHVRCGFVFGAQDPTNLREGCKVLSEMGVSCSSTVFTPKRGTPWENKKRPHVDDVWLFSLYLSELMRKYNLSPLYCRLSSRSEILWELLEDDQ